VEYDIQQGVIHYRIQLGGVMKANLFRMMAAMIVFMTLFVATVVPVSAKGEPKSLAFSGLQFIGYKGYVFTFKIMGGLKVKNLTGYVTVGSNRFSLNCKEGDGELVCSPSDSLRHYAGRIVRGAVGGFWFSALVPKAVIFNNTHCYSIFDYDQNEVWKVIGTYCTSNSSIAPTITYYNPDWDDTYTYYYYNNGSEAECQDPLVPDWGAGYYFDDPKFCD
jgi:hypothetical protein